VVDVVEAHIVGVSLLSWGELFFIVVNLFNFFSRFNDFFKNQIVTIWKNSEKLLKICQIFIHGFKWVVTKNKKDVSNFSSHKFNNQIWLN
jgi:hypothetical protein